MKKVILKNIPTLGFIVFLTGLMLALVARFSINPSVSGFWVGIFISVVGFILFGVGNMDSNETTQEER